MLRWINYNNEHSPYKKNGFLPFSNTPNKIAFRRSLWIFTGSSSSQQYLRGADVFPPLYNDIEAVMQTLGFKVDVVLWRHVLFNLPYLL